MDLRKFFFEYRSYTPIPLLLAILILADSSPASLACGFVLVLLGESLRIWAVRHAGGATRTTGGPGAGAELITHGPFAHVRNPLYLGNFILSLGFCIMAWAWMPWMFFVFLVLFGLQYGLIVSLEEERLRQHFGQAYENYFQHVPRFIPRLRPFQPQVVTGMSLRRALKIENNTLMSVFFVTLAIFLRWQLVGPH
ncbi:MAG: isoprenylcysteine carboxylmethyltransferase family protein [candidate division KSB1 bacterium]|nr:isoprenylcysteine carboxylmethyltransferase family protein [candidate division KSB1 bacterium]MDZ7304969.1 isoprenylcysteine carboxylmethyltransferase family protein [candidate division KSB1 bacterium]MDZ7313998.1 isoprenylcysteine carboxylmethyltransferase family protein [candidate division KSB1 bacterium]